METCNPLIAAFLFFSACSLGLTVAISLHFLAVTDPLTLLVLGVFVTIAAFAEAWGSD